MFTEHYYHYIRTTFDDAKLRNYVWRTEIGAPPPEYGRRSTASTTLRHADEFVRLNMLKPRVRIIVSCLISVAVRIEAAAGRVGLLNGIL